MKLALFEVEPREDEEMGNIFEIGIFIIVSIVAYRYQLIVTSSGWMEFILILYLLTLLSVTARNILRKPDESPFITSFSFGFFIGVYLWSMYCFPFIKAGYNGIVEPALLPAIFVIIMTGLLTGVISSGIAHLLDKLIRRMWGIAADSESTQETQ